MNVMSADTKVADTIRYDMPRSVLIRYRSDNRPFSSWYWKAGPLCDTQHHLGGICSATLRLPFFPNNNRASVNEFDWFCCGCRCMLWMNAAADVVLQCRWQARTLWTCTLNIVRWWTSECIAMVTSQREIHKTNFHPNSCVACTYDHPNAAFFCERIFIVFFCTVFFPAVSLLKLMRGLAGNMKMTTERCKIDAVMLPCSNVCQ